MPKIVPTMYIINGFTPKSLKGLHHFSKYVPNRTLTNR